MTRPAAQRALAWVALVAILALAGLALWARLTVVAPWEVELLQLAAPAPGPARDAVNALNTLGNLPVWAVLLALVCLVVARLKGLLAAIAVALTFAADLAAFGIKLVVERARPETEATEHFFGADAFAFPSGHVVRAVALVAVLAWLFAPRGARLPAALAGGVLAGVVMGFARVSLGVHWPTDALGGTLLGISWFALTGLVLTRNENERPRDPVTERGQRSSA